MGDEKLIAFRTISIVLETTVFTPENCWSIIPPQEHINALREPASQNIFFIISQMHDCLEPDSSFALPIIVISSLGSYELPLSTFNAFSASGILPLVSVRCFRYFRDINWYQNTSTTGTKSSNYPCNVPHTR